MATMEYYVMLQQTTAVTYASLLLLLFLQQADENRDLGLAVVWQTTARSLAAQVSKWTQTE